MRNNEAYLKHILDAIKKIESYLKTVKTYEEFSDNEMLFDAVTRQLGIIGEAANNVESDFQKRHNSIPWGQMVGMRNIIVHEYFGVNTKTVWDTAKNSLGPLKKTIRPFIGK